MIQSNYQNNKIYTIKGNIETNHIGLTELLKFYEFAKQFQSTTVTLDISGCLNVDANLSAVIFAFHYKLYKERRVKVYIELESSIHNVFFRNGLISQLQGFSVNKYTDDRLSTIPLKMFNIDEDENYCKYLWSEFFGHRGLADLDGTIKVILRTHYLEIFNNVTIHANSKYPLFTCGQYFPQKKILKFTLIDLGDGFLKKIKVYTGGQIDNDKSAIVWATENINSTKDKELFGPGGTGLKALKKYCNENNGTLQICSGMGFVTLLNNKTLENNLPYPLTGSLINIIFRDI